MATYIGNKFGQDDMDRAVGLISSPYAMLWKLVAN